ncbi:unnamed protein product [Eruca vesicaria subsp. sativa]|uniref:Uncharacterized protein n=1 Tax=Eruca vesicaria subsp. sativa TaxID=29727 RepID=A0ABC8M8A6_ERUVS|nr:unnamed protein product [Eruca vesicaria subsp. sativa]
MEGQAKLTRTHSPLLRSPSTVRSYFHSLNLISDDVSHEKQDLEAGEKEEKQRSKLFRSNPRTGLTRINPGLALTMISLSFLSLCSFFFFGLFSQTDEFLTSENLLLALIFVAVPLFLAAKNITLLNQTIHAITNAFQSKNRSKPVQWYIGDTETKPDKKTKRFVKEGVQFYSNGYFYEGEFHKGKCNGSGVYYYFVRGRYEGDWVDGRYDGHGIESWARGSRYKGQYRHGLRHGYGVYRFYTGDCYAGEWLNGQSHGFGVQSCADGSSYVGESRFGFKHGLGSYHFRNGDCYAGEYFGDKVHGFGVYRFANGHCYEGAWHEGRKQGYGAYSFRTGDGKSGEWDSGNLVTSLHHTSEQVRRAVQAARETAKKAAESRRRVDEQVSRAVGAANKAATAARVAAVKAVQNQMDDKFCQS